MENKSRQANEKPEFNSLNVMTPASVTTIKSEGGVVTEDAADGVTQREGPVVGAFTKQIELRLLSSPRPVSFARERNRSAAIR